MASIDIVRIMDLICTRYALLRCIAPGRLLDDLGGLEEDVWGDGEAERLGRLEVNKEIEDAGLLHRQVRGFGAFEDAVHIVGRAANHGERISAVAHQAPI